MSPRRHPVAAVLLVLVAALLVAGCGGGPSKEDYERGLGRVQADLEGANEASRDASQSDDEQVRSAALERAQAAIAKAADTADGLEPPDDAQAEHEQLTEALRDYAKLFGELATLTEGDSRQTALYGEAGDIVERLDDANRALDEAGYQARGTGDE